MRRFAACVMSGLVLSSTGGCMDPFLPMALQNAVLNDVLRQDAQRREREHITESYAKRLPSVYAFEVIGQLPLHPGDTVTLKVNSGGYADADSVTWTVSCARGGGTLAQTSGTQVVWTAPKQAGSCLIMATVRRGDNAVTISQTLIVTEAAGSVP